jgi:hypothetical protein
MLIDQQTFVHAKLRPGPAMVAAALICLGITAALPAQTPTPTAPSVEPLEVLRGRPDAQGVELLGERFESKSGGIALRVPALMRRSSSTAGEQIARFDDKQRGSWLIISRLPVSAPVSLSRGADGEDGVLDMLAARLHRADEGADIMRQEVIKASGQDAGLIVARTSLGLQKVLSQQLVIRQSDRLYYLVQFISPAARDTHDDTPVPADDQERQAVNALMAVAETVELLDTTALREDQDQRLFRTLGLLATLKPERLEATLVDQQWLRIMRAGQDVGYSYVGQHLEDRGPQHGLEVNIHSEISAAPAAKQDQPGGSPVEVGVEEPAPETPVGFQVPASGRVIHESSMWVSLDQQSELWTSQTQTGDALASSMLTEIGQSERDVVFVKDESRPMGDKDDPNNPPMRPEQVYELKVKHMGGIGGDQQVHRSLPPFYLPQALGQMLPRLVPLDQGPQSYLFTSYISGRHELMVRYVEVGAEQDVRLGGAQPVRAIPVNDRLEYEGPVTIHWISPGGQYLGSTNRQTGLSVLVSDFATIKAIWPQAVDPAEGMERP